MALKYKCPKCGDATRLYMRADVRWNPALQDWEPVDGSGEDYDIDCTECDWNGPLADAEDNDA